MSDQHLEHAFYEEAYGSVERPNMKADSEDGSSLSQPPRPDLTLGARHVALATTTDAEVKPWLLTAMDFLRGSYEPLEDDEATPQERSHQSQEGEG